MGRAFEFALTLWVTSLITTVFACWVASKVGQYTTELFRAVLDVLPC